MVREKLKELLQRMMSGDTRALARAMTLVERESDVLGEILRAIAKKQGHAFSVGVTGPPGAGKSSLVDGLITLMRG